MRKFKFLALAFAAFSFAACSDDAIEGQSGNGGVAGEGTPAYLTISFTANSGNSSRSTADDANNNGDEHSTDDPATGEDSGHQNPGTADENVVKTALIVVNPADGGNTAFAKLYTTAVTEGETAGEFTLVDDASKLYHNTTPIEVAVGKYDVLVVLNPVSELVPSGAQEGITNANAVQDLYNKIKNESYLPDETTYKSLVDAMVGEDGLMMANKNWNDGSQGSATDCSVELTSENNTPEKAATVTIDVERVMSKITFRDTKIDGMKDKNIYPVTVHTGVGTAVTVRGAILDETTADVENDYRIVVLNKAEDIVEHEVYALYEKETEDAEATLTDVYAATTRTTTTTDGNEYTIYTKLTAVTDATDYKAGTNYVADTSEEDNGLTLVLADMGDPTYWYVRLEGYALVNLSKDVHYVRHTIDNANVITPLGTLNGSNYLYTTNWAAKNAAEFNTVDGDVVFSNCDPKDWFYNTLAQVSGESETLTITETGGNLSFMDGAETAKYYKAMPSTTYEEGEDDVDDDVPHYNQSGEGVDNTPPIGNFMSYCFENSTDLNHQMHGISTGISFVARMYTDQECTQPVERLYQYAGQKFTSLKNIQDAFGSTRMSKSFNDLVSKESTITTVDAMKTELQKLEEDSENGGEHIEIYNDNICYYYTTEIKHFDNGDNAVLGNMEFAIMRNNIYSLSVSGINEIGDAIVDPTPNTPDETVSRAALTVQVRILPWIVRYNDIEF